MCKGLVSFGQWRIGMHWDLPLGSHWDPWGPPTGIHRDAPMGRMGISPLNGVGGGDCGGEGGGLELGV